ncbi:MAG: GGDEF domain-containing protein [Alphaproteobacteria bacterium]|nr:GGDEF domain-containing protein [Alphaproteobacteria bacterium]MBV8406267.1 GGDEF domain-containing protein [Alphaproteobacteria bacterium]
MELDVKTLLTINLAVVCLSSVTACYFWNQYRDNVWLLCWTVATAICGVALLLIRVFGAVPPLAIGPPIVLMLFSSYLLIWESMRLFNGRRLQPLRLGAIVLVFVAVLAVVVWATTGVNQRANFLSASLAILSSLSAYEVLRKDNEEFLRTRLAMAALFGAMAIVLALRAILGWLEPATATIDAYYDPLGGFSSLVNSIAIIGLSIALMMMANERTSGRHRRLALTDELTGLPNRRYFLTQAEQLLRRGGKDAPACILMMDLDHFSKVNERFGHTGGDEALISFAALLRQQLRSGDLVARYGGEEFCVLLIGPDRTQGLQLAEAIRSALAAKPVTIRGRLHPLTVSIGLAPLRGGDIDAALQLADKALYRAKGAGRNRVATWDGDPRSNLDLAAG